MSEVTDTTPRPCPKYVTVMQVNGSRDWHRNADRGEVKTACGKIGSAITRRDDWHSIRYRCAECCHDTRHNHAAYLRGETK